MQMSRGALSVLEVIPFGGLWWKIGGGDGRRDNWVGLAGHGRG